MAIAGRARLSALLGTVLFLGPLLPTSITSAQARRVVDVVTVGDPRSELAHDSAGEDVTAGLVDGHRFKQARGWLRYTLATFDDTEVTLVCTFRGSEGQSQVFDLLVEGQKVATRTVASASSASVELEFRLPLGVTAGRTNLAVTIRAVGGPTPRLAALRTVQEHLE
jgi:uncharacterized protein